MNRTIRDLVLGLAIGACAYLGGCGQKTAPVDSFPLIRKVSGAVSHIDEDSFVVRNDYGGANYQFENIRITTENEELKLVNRGPTSYKVGDEVTGLEYEVLEDGGVSYKELALLGNNSRTQIGNIEAHGIIYSGVN